MGALAGGSCSASNKDMAKERPQVSSSSKAGNFWVSVHRNGPLLFFPLVVREDGFYPLYSNTKQDGNQRPLSSSWKLPWKVLWHHLAPDQARQHQSRRVSSFEIVVQWLPQKAPHSRAPTAVWGDAGLDLLHRFNLISVDNFFVPVRKTKWTHPLPKPLIWEMKSRTDVGVGKVILQFFQTLLFSLENFCLATWCIQQVTVAATLNMCGWGSWKGYLARINVIEKYSFHLFDTQKILEISVMVFDPFHIIRDDHISHCLVDLFFF